MSARWLNLLAVGWLLAGCATEPPAVCTLSRAAAIPLEITRGKAVVTASINGKPARLAIDTGAFESMMFAAAAERLGVVGRSEGFLDYAGVGGRGRARVERISDFQLGRLHDRSVVIDVDEETSSSGLSGLDGLLGREMLDRYDLDFDLPGKRLILYGFRERCSTPSARLEPPMFAVPMTDAQHHLDTAYRVEVTIDGTPLRAILDSGSGYTVLFRSGVRKLGITPAAGDWHGRIGGLGPDKVDAWRRRFNEVDIGDLSLSHVPITVADEDAPATDGADLLIGLDTMRLIHVWVSNSSRTLILQFPPQRSPDPPPG